MRTLLLVDDQDDLRQVTKSVLCEFGYAVVSVACGEDALALFDPTVHQLVVTDNFMPGMSGVELARRIKLRSPATPVVMFSGSAPDDRSCLDAIIQRPVPMQVLREALNALLPNDEQKEKPRASSI